MSLLPYERHALRFMLGHLAVGTAGALVFGGLLLYLDIGSIRTMLMASREWYIFGGLLFFGLIVTFGGVAMGIGVMSLGEDKN
ncbi:MAG: hypothetical protein K9H25_08545 [Rhodospirillum sp.]|nr:hypothetical protein [Rhodospirillum sp.]MCF8489536.1 hypothetical protein [Rhodospirillum sp.]MCF8502045.1 hypothetical protein [Rhodospirillum sp.]